MIVRGDSPSAAKAEVESRPVIAALKRCATQRLYAALKRRSSTVAACGRRSSFEFGAMQGQRQKLRSKAADRSVRSTLAFVTRAFIHASCHFSRRGEKWQTVKVYAVCWKEIFSLWRLITANPIIANAAKTKAHPEPPSGTCT